MSAITTLAGETVDEKDLRAATEGIDVDLHAPGMFLVTSGDGESEYVVEIGEPACECGDFFYRNNHCKHLRKIEMLADQRPIPDVPDLDADLRELRDDDDDATVEGASGRRPIADGGVRTADAGSQAVLDPDGSDEISIHRIVCEMTSTVEDLPDFSRDEENPADRGEPYRSIELFAYDTVERLITEETQMESNI